MVGAGYSAATSVRNLLCGGAEKIFWVTRRKCSAGGLYDVIEDDVLRDREALCRESNALIVTSSSESRVLHLGGKQVIAMKLLENNRGVQVTLESLPLGDEEELDSSETDEIEVDFAIINTGLRPNNSLHDELQV